MLCIRQVPLLSHRPYFAPCLLTQLFLSHVKRCCRLICKLFLICVSVTYWVKLYRFFYMDKWIEFEIKILDVSWFTVYAILIVLACLKLRICAYNLNVYCLHVISLLCFAHLFAFISKLANKFFFPAFVHVSAWS